MPARTTGVVLRNAAPQPQVTVLLVAGDGSLCADATETDADGRFTVEGDPDDPTLIVKARQDPAAVLAVPALAGMRIELDHAVEASPLELTVEGERLPELTLEIVPYELPGLRPDLRPWLWQRGPVEADLSLVRRPVRLHERVRVHLQHGTWVLRAGLVVPVRSRSPQVVDTRWQAVHAETDDGRALPADHLGHHLRHDGPQAVVLHVRASD